MFNGTGVKGGFWHAVDDTALLVLPQGGRSLLPHVKQSFRTVLSHAGENHAEGSSAYFLGDRVKQDIHGWAAAMDWFSGRAVQHNLSTAAADGQMLVARGDIDVVGPDNIPGSALLDREDAFIVEALC